MNLALLVVALVIDLCALAGVLYRISFYDGGLTGLTPNRVAMLGLNLLVFVHLSVATWRYSAYLRERSGLSAVRTWIVGYLPLYGAWAELVAFVVPAVFSFR